MYGNQQNKNWSTNEETYLQIRLSRAFVFIIIISFPDSFRTTIFLSFCLRRRETNKAEEHARHQFPWVTYTAYWATCPVKHIDVSLLINLHRWGKWFQLEKSGTLTFQYCRINYFTGLQLKMFGSWLKRTLCFRFVSESNS